MASVVISGDTSGTATIQAQAVAGNTTLTLPTTTGTFITTTGGVTPSTSGNVLTSDGSSWTSAAIPLTGVGQGQTWQNFTTVTRVMGTTYTNSTGKPIMVVVGYGRSQSSDVTVGGVTIATLRHDSNNNNPGYFSFIVPNGATYANTGTYSSDSGAAYWSELR